MNSVVLDPRARLPAEFSMFDKLALGYPLFAMAALELQPQGMLLHVLGEVRRLVERLRAPVYRAAEGLFVRVDS